MRDRAALGGMFPLRLDGDRVLTKDVELAFREGLLIQLTALGGRRNRIEHTGFSNACFGVVGDELIAVSGNPDTRVARSGSHLNPRVRRLAPRCRNNDSYSEGSYSYPRPGTSQLPTRTRSG